MNVWYENDDDVLFYVPESDELIRFNSSRTRAVIRDGTREYTVTADDPETLRVVLSWIGDMTADVAATILSAEHSAQKYGRRNWVYYAPSEYRVYYTYHRRTGWPVVEWNGHEFVWKNDEMEGEVYDHAAR